MSIDPSCSYRHISLVLGSVLNKIVLVFRLKGFGGESDTKTIKIVQINKNLPDSLKIVQL